MRKAKDSFTLYDFKKIKNKPFIIALVVMIGIVLAGAWIMAYQDLKSYHKSDINISIERNVFPPAGYRVKENQYRDVSATVELEADLKN